MRNWTTPLARARPRRLPRTHVANVGHIANSKWQLPDTIYHATERHRSRNNNKWRMDAAPSFAPCSAPPRCSLPGAKSHALRRRPSLTSAPRSPQRPWVSARCPFRRLKGDRLEPTWLRASVMILGMMPVMLMRMAMMMRRFSRSRLLYGGGRCLPRQGGLEWEGPSEVVAGGGIPPPQLRPLRQSLPNRL